RGQTVHAGLRIVAPSLELHLDLVCRLVLEKIKNPCSAARSTAARSRTKGDTVPSFTELATVTGFVRNNQTVARASTMAIAAIAPNTPTPKPCRRITLQGRSYRTARIPRAAGARPRRRPAETCGRWPA